MLEKGNLENRYSKLENHAKGLTSSNFISRGSGELTKDVIVNVVMEGFETHMNDENLNTVLGIISTAL